MRQQLEIRNRIGIVGKGAGYAIFFGLMLSIGLAWMALAYLDGRKRDYEERIVGALKFLDWTIAATHDLDAELYAPSLEPRADTNRWVMSGIMIIREDQADEPRGLRNQSRFSADMESICSVYANPNCWRLARLVVGGHVIIEPGTVRSDDAVPPQAQSSDDTVAPQAPPSSAGTAARQAPSPEVTAVPQTPTSDDTAARQALSTDDTVTPQDRAGKIAVRIPLPKEPASRIPPELPVQPWVAAAHPHKGMPLAVPAGLPCIEMDAWRDPDIARNRHLILNEPLCLSVIEFTENDLNWRVQVFDSGRPGYKWIVLHDDEDAAFDSALYAIARYGGKVVDVDLLPPTRSRAFVDPNRNFAFVDAHRRTCIGPVRRAAPLFTSTILKLLGSPPYLALHNNYDGHLLGGGAGNISVHHSTQGLFGLPANKTGERLADEDNFILVSGLLPPDSLADRERHMIDQLRYAGVNVIYEHVRPDTYDCSLSNFLLLHGGAKPGQYFNVESELGDYQSQVTMIDALVGTLDSPLRASH